MSKGPTTFRQRDAAALIKAAKAAGLTVVRVEAGKDGRIVVVTSEAAAGTPAADKNEWDE